ncbi:hypothetical protein V1638_09005 [Pseudarthrobacter sp. J64]|uniref:hypothetical protein n=1 Tax=Pseudarthrobacter sp. J64 TaxID=3116485 RepID=UPI002E8213B1|nr:hypothetical protein [Pseudarthrobacter sp. J64]MEE2569534.1 hypothetical protein [Pseudarthrobacter sp. J64]
MTELNPPAAEAVPDWPHLDHHGHNPEAGGDAAVSRAVAPLQEIPDLPVADHPERFAQMHDALLEALNSEPAVNEQTAQDPANDAPRPGGR